MRRPLSQDRPTLYRHETIELSEKRIKLRVVLLILAVAAAAVSFAYGINALFSTEPGVREITALTGEMNSGDEFTFYYHLGAGETSATEEQKAVRSLYTQAVTDAFQLFSADLAADGRRNLWYLNRHPNQEVAVDPALYEALTLLEDSGARYHYLGPMAELYFSLSQSASDQEAAQFDPRRSQAVADFCREAVRYTGDPRHIRLELLGENTVCLRVSEAYLAFAEENGIGRLVDLSWMKNAFAADYIAGELTAAGYTRGMLISRDSFVRGLGDAEGIEYALTFTHREGNTVSNLATVRFSGAVSMVFLRDYPVDNAAAGNYYIYEDGAIRSPFLDPADGLDRASIPELAAYAEDLDCAEVALRIAPIYIADTFDGEALASLAREGVYAYYQAGGELCSTEGQ